MLEEARGMEMSMLYAVTALGEQSHGNIVRAILGVPSPCQSQRNGTKLGPGEAASPVYSGSVR